MLDGRDPHSDAAPTTAVVACHAIATQSSGGCIPQQINAGRVNVAS